MLPWKYRLPERKDFDRVLKKGQAKTGGCLTLKFLDNNLAISRFGFLVSLKTAKRANERNQLKRKLRQAVRELLSQAPPGKDLLLIARPCLARKKLSEIRQITSLLFNEL